MGELNAFKRYIERILQETSTDVSNAKNIIKVIEDYQEKEGIWNKSIWRLCFRDVESVYREVKGLDIHDDFTETQKEEVLKIAKHVERYFVPYEWSEQLHQFVEESLRG